MGNDLTVRFWGVRGSYPVPGTNTLRYGGNTSCVEVRARNHLIILDAGTGIINLGHKLINELRQDDKQPEKLFVVNLLLTHTHHDHLQGLLYFTPAYRSENILNIYGPKCFSQDLEQVISQTMQPQYSPVEFDELSSRIQAHNLNENHLLVFGENSNEATIHTENNVRMRGNNVIVRMMRSYAHPKIGVFVFRIEVNGKSVVYATDTEGYVGGDARLIEFAKNADLLIHDAQYDSEEYKSSQFPKQGYGHSTYEMAANVANAANVKNLVLFHHAPFHDDDKIADMEAKTREIFPNTTAGAEGLEFNF